MKVSGGLRLSPEQVKAGLRMRALSRTKGGLAGSSLDAEATAPRTWIRYIDGAGKEICVLECELYRVPHHAGGAELIGMLHIMCPKCGETSTVREDNKTLHLGSVELRHAPKWLAVHYEYRCRELRRTPMPEDQIPLVSSPERWGCDYCKRWWVRVTEGIASDDDSGVERIVVPLSGLLGSKG